MSELPEGWTRTKLGDLCEIARGGSPRPIKDYLTTAPNGINWVKISDATASTKYIFSTKEKIRPEGLKKSRLVEDGDFLLSNSMSFGRPYIMRTTGCIHDGWLVLRDRAETFYQEYLYHFLGSPVAYQQFDRLAAGTTVRNLNSDLVREVDVLLPPMAEQRRIAAKIDSLTGKSRRARDHLDHIPRLVEKYKQAVLARLLSSPDGQQVTRFGDVADLLNGDRGQHYPNDSEQLSEGHCLFLGTRNVRQGFFDFSETSFISREKHFSLRGGTMERGDIVVTVRGTLGNCAVFDASVPFDLVRINSAMMIVRPIADADPEYLMWTIRSPVFLGWVGANARGSAQPHLRARDIEQTEVYFPSIERQREAVQRIKDAFNWIDRLASEATSARRLIDRLDQTVLAKAFRGELVPQDPDDEPATVLLERIRAAREAAPKAKRGRRAK